MKIDAVPELQIKQLAAGQAESPSSPKAVDGHSEKLRDAAQQFEALFVGYLLKNMRKTIPESKLFGSGLSGDLYRGMFDQKIAETVAGKGGIGLADNLIEYLQRNTNSKSPEDSEQNDR